MTAAPRADLDRLLADLDALAAFGANLPPEPRRPAGVSRSSFSPADRSARQWLARRCRDAGLSWRSDGLGNVFCRLDPPGGDRSLPAVWTGSHIDSVPNGGTLDGALGVLGALECCRRLAEEGVPLRRSIQLVVFSDEEGCYRSLLGSTGLTRGYRRAELAALRGRDGRALTSALAEADHDPDGASETVLDPAAVHAFVELHIEQGPVLERHGVEIGVVSSIVGIGGGTVEFRGREDHAGTTEMGARRDALRAAGHFLAALPAVSALVSAQAVVTCGTVELEPGATNVVPRLARLGLDFRDATAGQLEELRRHIDGAAERAAGECDVTVEVDLHEACAPVALSPQIMAAIEGAATNLGCSSEQLVSRAGHDAQNMARVVPTGMVFVPSIAGRSHSPAEATKHEDIERGVNVLIETLTRLAC